MGILQQQVSGDNRDLFDACDQVCNKDLAKGLAWVIGGDLTTIRYLTNGGDLAEVVIWQKQRSFSCWELG